MLGTNTQIAFPDLRVSPSLISTFIMATAPKKSSRICGLIQFISHYLRLGLRSPKRVTSLGWMSEIWMRWCLPPSIFFPVSLPFKVSHTPSHLTVILDEHFYPCSGSGADDTLSPLIINIPLSPARPFIWDPKTRSKLSSSQRYECCTHASKEFRCWTD